MGGHQRGRLLLYQDGVRATAEFGKLATALQQRLPDCVVEQADEEWLAQAIVGSAAEGAWRSYHPDSEIPKYRWPEQAQIEYIYLVLGWLGGTLSKQVVEQAVNAAADAVRKWWQSRRTSIVTVAYIFGPKGEVLSKVRMEPSQPSRKKRDSGLRRIGSWRRRARQPPDSREL
jgi:hypothetical protein